MTSLLYHTQEWHLYYNMSSLLWKGSSLERAIGTKRQIAITLLLGFLTQFLYISCAYFRQQILGDATAMFTALSGFSGVLFGYKVLLTQGAPPEHMSALMGILPLQTRYLVWGELVLIHVMFPSSSFIAHLCGIAAALTISMGWFDAFITAADHLPDLGVLQGAPGGNPQGENRVDNAWQAQAPLYGAQGEAPREVGRPNEEAEEEQDEQQAPRPRPDRQEIRRRALAAAEARRQR